MDNADSSYRVVWWLLLVLVLVAPVLVGFDRYLIHVGIVIAFNVALAASLWLIWSLGVVSFAHAGFMGIAAPMPRRWRCTSWDCRCGTACGSAR